MNKSFQEYFCCSAMPVNFSVQGQPGGSPGFFRLGHDAVYFGKLYPSLQPRLLSRDYVDVSTLLDVRDHTISLPFDLNDVVSSLRMETYAGMMDEKDTYLGTDPLLRKLYYWARPILPVSIRSVLQRIKLQRKLSNAFPSWPVDRSVDILFEKTMMLAIHANG